MIDPSSLTSAALLRIAGSSLSFDEKIVRAAADYGTSHEVITHIADIANMVQKSAIFVLSSEEFAEIKVLEELPTELPHLPFGHMTVEFRDRDGDANHISYPVSIGDADRGHLRLDLLMIVGTPDLWAISGIGSTVSTTGLVKPWAETRTFPNSNLSTTVKPGRGNDFFLLAEAISAVTFVDLIAPRLTPQATPRGLRRSFERQFKQTPPKIYEVHLAGCGEQHAGNGTREYHCRWIVRGHWRYHRNGQRSWVRPHVKGPVGAPWRGRPIYTTRLSAEAAA